MSLLSSSRPRYLASFEWGITELLKETSGQSLGLRVKVMCVDFNSFTLIFHALHHFESMLRWFWRWWEQMCGSELAARMAVSSAYVPIIVFSVVGMSAVNMMYKNGAMSLPWGTPASIS